MKLYHLSFNLNADNLFQPRIPNRRADEEDNNIPRVSTALTVRGALTGIPEGGSGLSSTLIENDFLVKIYEIDTEKIGIPEDEIIKSDFLYNKDYVRDAEITGECWITTDFKVPDEDIYIAKITDWGERATDYLPADMMQEVLDTDGDIERVWYKYNSDDTMIPSITEITYVDYKKIKKDTVKDVFTSKIKFYDEEIDFEFMQTDEGKNKFQKICENIKNQYPIDKIEFNNIEKVNEFGSDVTITLTIDLDLVENIYRTIDDVVTREFMGNSWEEIQGKEEKFYYKKIA